MGFFDKLFSAFKKSSKDVEGQLDEAAKVVMEKASEFKDIAADKMEEMAPMVDKAKETLSEKLGEAGEVLSDAKDKASAKFEEFSNAAEKDAAETAEKGDNLEELMENNHLDALKNTKLTGEHKGQPIEDAVSERIEEMKGQATKASEVKNEYDQDLVLPDLPETPVDNTRVETTGKLEADEIEGLIEAPDETTPSAEGITEKLHGAKESVVEDIEAVKENLPSLPTKEGVAEKLDAAKESLGDQVEAAKDGLAETVEGAKEGLTEKLDDAKGKIAGVGAGVAGVAGGLGATDLKDKASEVLGDATAKLDETVEAAKESLPELPSTEGLTDNLDSVKESMGDQVQAAKDGLAEKVEGAKEGLAEKLDDAKGKIAGVGAGIAGAAGGLGGTDLKDKAEAILGDTTAKLDETVEKAKDLGGQLEEQANAIKEKHIKTAESIDNDQIIEELEAFEEPAEKDPNEEPSFRDLVDDAKDALFGLKDSINKKID